MLPDTLDTEKNTDWIALLHAGDRDVFGQLYARFAIELLAFFASRTSTHNSAEDMSQSVWLKLWENRLNFRHGDFRAWMYRIAHNLLIDLWRKKYPTLLEEYFDPAQPIFDQENDQLEALRECLESIEGSFVEVVRGKTQGLTTLELAAKYNIDSKTVATRIHRGKQLLRECVERKTK